MHLISGSPLESALKVALMIGFVIVLVLDLAIRRRLKVAHLEVWKEVGPASLPALDMRGRTTVVGRFIWGQKYEGLGDKLLTALCRACWFVTMTYFLIFASLVALGLSLP